jgi:hypothetical protein
MRSVRTSQNEERGVAQAGRRRLLRAERVVLSRMNSCDVPGEGRGVHVGKVFLRFSLPNHHSTLVPYSLITDP